MGSKKDTYIEVVNNLKTVSDEEKKLLLKMFKKMDKERFRNEFMVMRTLKDKEIATNILNATIKDLNIHKKEVEDINIQLSEQKTIIEEKSRTLEENLQKLELSYKELEQFSYIASHDLKSPLRTISSFAQLLKRRYYNKIDQDANEFIEFIVSGVQQMNDVIRNSLEYAKVGKDESIPEPTDLNTVLGLVQLNLKEEIEDNKAQIIIPEHLPTIFANKTSMLQLFQNLINNAIKFRKGITPIITISFKQKNETEWEFQVADNGIGMNEIYQERAFMPFKRITQDQPGQGIGLAICKKIVENHSGKITFKSTESVGTTFIFTFPMN